MKNKCRVVLLAAFVAVTHFGCATVDDKSPVQLRELAQSAKKSEKRDEALAKLIENGGQGDPAAIEELREYYESQPNNYQTRDSQRRWLEASAETGNPDSLRTLADEALADLDYQEAEGYLEPLAEQNEALAQAQLGWLHYRALHTVSSLQKARILFNLSANQNNALARTGLGFLFLEGDLATIDLDKSYQHFAAGMEGGEPLAIAGMSLLHLSRASMEKAYDLALQVETSGDPLAGGYIANLLLEGIGGEVQLARGISLVNRATSVDSLPGIVQKYNLAASNRTKGSVKRLFERALKRSEALATIGRKFPTYLYLDLTEEGITDGVLTRPASSAREWFEALRFSNDYFATIKVFYSYLAGHLIEKDIETARNYLSKAGQILANDRTERSLNILNRAKAVLQVVSNDPSSPPIAFPELRDAAKLGDFWALGELVHIYYNGPKPGKPGAVTEDETYKALQQLANRGFPYHESQLGFFYQNTRGDYAKSYTWTKKAADKGDATAQYNLGLMYSNGTGVTQDLRSSAQYFKKSAAAGNAGGEYHYAIAQILGRGVSVNFTTGFNTLVSLTTRDDPAAGYSLNTLGVLYRDGLKNEITPDPKTAINYFFRGAEAGNSDAQFHLAELYQSGTGVPRSDEQAIYWYQKAAEGNHINARAYLAALPGYSPPEPQQPSGGSGTGWISEYGLIVTNHHVIEDTTIIYGLIHGETEPRKLEVVDIDTDADLAILKPVLGNIEKQGLRLTPRKPGVGADVLAIGYPHFDILGIDPKVTDGIISSENGLGGEKKTYQISNAIQSGNSGGPLIDLRGNVVGIIKSKLAADWIFQNTGDLPQNVNYAVKSPLLEKLLLGNIGASNGSVSIKSNSNKSELIEAVLPTVVLILTER